MDLLSKKPVTVRISAQSQLRKLPPEIAQRLAARLRGGTAGSGASGGAAQGATGTGAAASGAPPPAAGQATGSAQGPSGGTPNGPGGARGGADFQQMVNRLPQVALADLQKGEAVILVATEGADSGPVTAITLLGGVEPLLTASPRASQAFTLSPWNLGGAAEGGGEPNP
jgi:hypothetical protein